MWYLIIIGYLLSCVTSYGIFFGYFQQNPKWKCLSSDDYRTDMGICILLSLAGPISLFVALFTTGMAQHGIKFR